MKNSPAPVRSDPVHETESILMLHFNLNSKALSFGIYSLLESCKVKVFFRGFCEQDHCEDALHDSLAYIDNINIITCHNRGDSGNDSYPVAANNRDNETA